MNLLNAFIYHIPPFSSPKDTQIKIELTNIYECNYIYARRIMG